MDSKLKVGDLLYRRKGIFDHVGVYMGNNQVFHNSPSGDTEVVSYHDYAECKAVSVVAIGHHNSPELIARLEVMLLADSRYHPAANNCEHIANELIHGRRYSPQLQAGVICAGLAGLISWKSQKGSPLLMMLTGAISGCLLSNAIRKYDGRVPASLPAAV